jgi:imidazolonepropionase-like amidohydrolase
MMKYWLLAAAVLLLGAAPPKPSSVVVLSGATLIDGTGGPAVPDAQVVIRDGRIVAAGPRGKVEIPAGARMEDLTGRYLVPGFFDMHAHVTILFGSMDAKGYDAATSATVLRQLLAFGITTVRNPASPLPTGVELRDAVARGTIPGPRIFTTGEAINGGSLSGPGGIVHTPDEARREVDRQAAAGVDAIKLYSGLPPDTARAAIAEARSKHIRVIGHLGATTWTEGAEAGIDGVEHGAPWTADWLAPADREDYRKAIREQGGMKARILWLERLHVQGPEVAAAVDALARHHVAVDPTLIAYVTKFRGDDPQYIASPDFKHVPAPMLADWKKGTFVSDWTADDFRRAHAVWPKLLELVKLYHGRGVTLLAGSDLPNPWVIPGISFHQELALLAEAGIPPRDILRIATHNGAEALGILGDAGTLEPGKRADVIVLSADPLADIRNTRGIEKVMQGGGWVSRLIVN